MRSSMAIYDLGNRVEHSLKTGTFTDHKTRTDLQANTIENSVTSFFKLQKMNHIT